MTATAPVIHMLIASAILALPSCDCRSRESPESTETAVEDFELPRKPVTNDGRDLDPASRRLAARLTALVRRYYPAWAPERESMDDYFARIDSSPETERLRTLIRRRVESDRIWRACLGEIKYAVRRSSRQEFIVRNGNPPMFYIPSFQVVLLGEHSRGRLTMVFRLSMLARLLDYYERIDDPITGDVETNLSPTDETVAIATLVRGIIAKHYPAYRALPPEIGAVQVPNILHAIAGGDEAETSVRDATLTELLFEDTRRW